jgi:pilus assembly protein CpaD
MSRTASKGRAIAAAVTVAALASLALAACQDERRVPDYVAVHLNDTTLRHPIGFDEQREVLNVDVPPRTASLSHNQVADLQRFVARYKAEGVGRLSVTVGSQERSSAAGHALDDLGRILKESGISPSQVAKGRHADTHRSRALVRLSYARPTAIPPECGHWHRDIGRERERLHYPEFGCATQRNLAGMVANARDLQRPQDEQPRSAERRSQTWSKYIAPEQSESTAETKAKAVETTKKQ